MKKPSIFYIQPDNKDIQTFEYIASESRMYDDDIKTLDVTMTHATVRPLYEALKACLGEHADLRTPEAMRALSRAEKFFRILEGGK